MSIRFTANDGWYNNCMEFQHEIIKCISSKREGPYWDFKRQWYEKDEKGRSNLLFDIICMNNIVYNRDSYIIIGIDEENDYKSSDISKDPNRRNTQNLTDFINNKKFAGDIRPIVHVESIIIDCNKIDVIVVHNNLLTPVYLNESYETINAYYVYSRLQDSNTPKNKQVDQYIIEGLWKKRFGLNINPLERMVVYLNNQNNWKKKEKWDKGIFYYSDFPEFTIEYSYESENGLSGYEYYLFSQTDIKPSWNDIKLKYHQTELEEFEGMFLDGGRNLMCVPDMGFLKINGETVCYKFYIKGSLKCKLNEFLIDKYSNRSREAIMSKESLMKCVLFFYSDLEKNEFESYIKTKIGNFPECEELIPRIPDVEGYIPGVFKKRYKLALQLNILLDKYRKDHLLLIK